MLRRCFDGWTKGLHRVGRERTQFGKSAFRLFRRLKLGMLIEPIASSVVLEEEEGRSCGSCGKRMSVAERRFEVRKDAPSSLPP